MVVEDEIKRAFSYALDSSRSGRRSGGRCCGRVGAPRRKPNGDASIAPNALGSIWRKKRYQQKSGAFEFAPSSATSAHGRFLCAAAKSHQDLGVAEFESRKTTATSISLSTGWPATSFFLYSLSPTPLTTAS